MKSAVCFLLIKIAILAQCHADVIFERIKNGQVVSGDDLYFTARIDLNGKQVCNGALVSNRWVITEKSCIDKAKLAKYLISFSSLGSSEVNVTRTVIGIKTADKKNNELVLLQLNENIIRAEDGIKPLGRFSTKKLNKKMKTCKAVGFSENGQRLVELTVGLKKTSKCRKTSSKKNICFDTKKGSLCKVDHGSPIVCKYKTKWYLVGTALVTKGCSNTNVKGALISLYGKAIQKVLNDKNNIDCGPVPQIENRRAKLVDGSTKFRSKAKVSCELGFKTDKNEIQCQDSGKWETSTCVLIGCGPPPEIANGNVILKDGSTNTTSLAEVQCFPGYKSNATFLICQISDNWENTTCEEIENFDNRLTNTLIPLNYELELKPDFYDPSKTFSFTGSVTITVECKNDTSLITLNMYKLSIKEDIEVMESKENIYKGHEYDEQKQVLYIKTKRLLTAANKYSVDIKFSGRLNGNPEGLVYQFRSGSRQIAFVASHMKPIFARRVFPCFDEPAFKSTFDVTILRKKPMKSFSNMPVKKSVKRDDSWIADIFSRTPVMSTYLLAVFVSDFDSLEKTTTNDVKFRTFSKSEVVDFTQYSLDAGVKMMPFLEDYFNLPYMLPKQDMVAASRFGDGAGVENWGLIIFKQTTLLVEAKTPSYDDREIAASNVANTLAHIWFGNLVTADWWTELWLNEGFAKYFQYITVDSVNPEWKMDDVYIKESLQKALEADSKADTHPLNNDVVKLDEIDSDKCDTITCHKGAAIVRMLRVLVGDSTFQKGLQVYLKSRSYGTVTKDDLWSVMQKQSIVDKRSITNIKGIMDTWVLQKNYPVVKVEFSEEGKITLTQSRFTDSKQNDTKQPESPFGYKWNIPFAYATSSTKKFDVKAKDITIMKLGKDTVTIKDNSIPKPKGNKWVLGNPNQYGYFRVNYDNRNWNALADQLVSDHTVFPVSNRAQLIQDAWKLQSVGEQRLFIALRTFEYLDDERDWLPWDTAKPWLQQIGWKIDSNAVYQRYKKCMRVKTKDIYEELIQNTNKYTFSQSKLTDNIRQAACWYGLTLCVDDAKQELSEWKADPENLTDEDFTREVYCSAITAGSQDDWEFVLDQFYKDQTNSRRRLALTCTKNASNVEVLFDAILDRKIYDYPALFLMIDLSRNPLYRIRLWEYLTATWDNFLAKFFGNVNVMKSIVESCSESLRTVEGLEMVKAFRKSREGDFERIPELEKAIDDAIIVVNENIDWITNNLPAVDKWLTNLGY